MSRHKLTFSLIYFFTWKRRTPHITKYEISVAIAAPMGPKGLIRIMSNVRLIPAPINVEMAVILVALTEANMLPI